MLLGDSKTAFLEGAVEVVKLLGLQAIEAKNCYLNPDTGQELHPAASSACTCSPVSPQQYEFVYYKTIKWLQKCLERS